MAFIQRHSVYRFHRAFSTSPLILRILVVNIGALIVLMVGLLHLSRYQERLIQTELNALRSEARIVSAALGEGAVIRDIEEGYEIEPETAHHMIRRLVKITHTRTRLFSSSGHLLVDSRILSGTGIEIQVEELPPISRKNDFLSSLRNFFDYSLSILTHTKPFPKYPENNSAQASEYPDVVHAFEGESSAKAWSSTNRRLLLTVAVPVQRYKNVLGAVLLSHDGRDIEQAMHGVRMDILKVFLIALGITVLLSLYLSSTVVRPIHKLARAAERVRFGLSRQHAIPDFTNRRDEIGYLSGALRDMTAALWARIDAIESFAADVSHEIKNPLTSLQSAVETVQKVQDTERQKRLLEIIQHDVQRLDRLISDISDASRLDAELSRAQFTPVNITEMLRSLVDIYKETTHNIMAFSFESQDSVIVPGIETRLMQVFQNLLDNAISFSPPQGIIRIRTELQKDHAVVTIEDQGPGIPESKLETIFERFYTERPAGEDFGKHSGLGLSISRQVIQAHNGTITAQNCYDENRKIIGAIFTVSLPRG